MNGGSRVNRAISGGRTKTEKRNMKVSEARPLLEEGESERLINQDTVCAPPPPLPSPPLYWHGTQEHPECMLLSESGVAQVHGTQGCLSVRLSACH